MFFPQIHYLLQNHFFNLFIFLFNNIFVLKSLYLFFLFFSDILPTFICSSFLQHLWDLNQLVKSKLYFKIKKDWRFIEKSVVESIQSVALVADSSNKTHPINKDVFTPTEILSIFDHITYAKGK